MLHHDPDSGSAAEPGNASAVAGSLPTPPLAQNRTSDQLSATLDINDKGTVLLKLPAESLGLIAGSFTVDGLEFIPKAETHITLLGFKHSSEMKKALADPERGPRLRELAATVNDAGGVTASVDSGAPILRLGRDIEVSLKGGAQRKEHHESFIVAVDSTEARAIIKSIGEILGTEFPDPYLHITLYTHGSPTGIGVTDNKALEGLKVGEISVEQFRALAAGSTSVTVATPLNPAQCGESLIAARQSPDPVREFERLIERPGAREALGAILALRHIPQDPRHHPEGDVYIHTMGVVEEAAKLCAPFGLSNHERTTALLSALLHDIGKGVPGITKIIEDPGEPVRITAYGHEKAGVEPARRILTELGLVAYAPDVLAIVEHHMNVPARYREVTKGNMAIVRCIERTREFIEKRLQGTNPQLLHLCTIADWRGRGLPDSAPAREAFIAGFSDVFSRALNGKTA